MIRIERAVLRDEVQQMRHLLQVGGNVRVIPRKVNIVELNVDYMLDLAAG